MDRLERSGNEAGLVFLLGAPRSGTTWLQSLLGAHPAIATPQETDLFSRYVVPLDEAWRWQTRGGPDDWADRRYKGLPALLTAGEFEELVRGVAMRAVDAILEQKPGAAVVLEKSPLHALSADVIQRYLPEARFVHLIRDGRDVAASLIGASGGWGRAWAPATVRAAARTWVDHVTGARAVSGDGSRYLEVRYEHLLDDGVAVLRRVFQFCGVDAEPADCGRLLDEMSFATMAADRKLAPSILIGGEWAKFASEIVEPEGFFRRGGAGAWRDDWSKADRRRFAEVAGGLLMELGYESDSTWAGSGHRGVIDALNSVAARTAARISRMALKRAEGWRERAT